MELDEYNKIQTILVENPNDPKKKIKIIGTDTSVLEKRLTIPDIYAAVSYYLNLHENIGNTDEIF